MRAFFVRREQGVVLGFGRLIALMTVDRGPWTVDRVTVYRA